MRRCSVWASMESLRELTLTGLPLVTDSGLGYVAAGCRSLCSVDVCNCRGVSLDVGGLEECSELYLLGVDKAAVAALRAASGDDALQVLRGVWPTVQIGVW